MKKEFIPILSAIILLSGCGGALDKSTPVSKIQAGDSKLTCEDMEYEFEDIDQKMRKLVGEEEYTKSKNVALGTAGFVGAFIIFWPLAFAPLFIDLSPDEQVEAEAMQARAKHLERLARKKDCDFIG